MTLALISQALYLLFKLALFALGIICASVLVVGVLQVATQIQDTAIGVLGRVAGCALFLFLFGSTVGGQLVAYSQQLWGNAQYFN